MKFAVAFALMMIGLYVGVAGYSATKMLQQSGVTTTTKQTNTTYEYNGIVFRDEQSLKDFLDEQQSGRWFGWIFTLPAGWVLLLACMAFGLFGGALRVLIALAKSTNVQRKQVVLEPLIGLGLGVVLFFFALALPAIFSTASGPTRPETALAFSIAAGLFSERAYTWLEKQVTRFFFPTAAQGE